MLGRGPSLVVAIRYCRLRLDACFQLLTMSTESGQGGSRGLAHVLPRAVGTTMDTYCRVSRGSEEVPMSDLPASPYHDIGLLSGIA